MSGRRALAGALAVAAAAALPAPVVAPAQGRAHAAAHGARHHHSHHRRHQRARLSAAHRYPRHVTRRLPAAPGAAPAAGPPTGSTKPTSPTPAPPAPTPPVLPARLGVVAREYSFQLSRLTVAEGSVIVELDVAGQDPHALAMRLTGGGPLFSTATVPAGRHVRATFDLPPGTYRLWCPIADHDERGMHATLLVGG